MKKVLLALCAVMMLGMMACNDDPASLEPVNPSGGHGGGGGGGEQPEQIPTGEGIYSPAQKIDTILVDEAISETWTWNNNKLMQISSLEGGSSFTYNGWRMATMSTVLQQVPVEATYNYSGDKLATVDAYSGGVPALGVIFGHNAAGKIDHLTLDINSNMLAMLSQLLGGGLPGFNWGDFFKKSSKFSLDSTNLHAYLTWQGDDVTSMILSGSVNGQVTLGEVGQFINVDSLLGGMTAMLADTNLKVKLEIGDTMTYAYDTYHNPFCGFLGTLDATVLSAHNMTSMLSSGVVRITVTATTLFGTVPLQLPAYSLGERMENRTYTYDNNGYPLTFTNDEGSVTRYIYKR